jgi:hypothetical protein
MAGWRVYRQQSTSASTLPSPRAAVALGLAAAAAGVLIILFAAGVLGSDRTLETPRWVGFCAGFMFVCLGAALIVGYAVAGAVGPDGDLPDGTPFGIRLAQYLLGLGVTSSMAAIFSWIAFGPGPRRFSMTVSLPFFASRGQSGETAGRVVFGVAAVLIYVFVGLAGFVGLRRLRDRARSAPPDRRAADEGVGRSR